MLEAIPISSFSSNYRLREQNLLVGELDNSKLRDKARLELEEGSYNLYRENFFSGDFVPERLGNIVREWPIADRTFLYWLAFIMWKRQNDPA